MTERINQQQSRVLESIVLEKKRKSGLQKLDATHSECLPIWPINI